MKRKFSLILNISSLCITIASIIIGVYALQQASLSLKGSVGFVAHNSNVVVTPYITGYDGTESTSVMQTRAEQEALELGGSNGEMVGTLTLHNLNFNDMKNMVLLQTSLLKNLITQIRNMSCILQDQNEKNDSSLSILRFVKSALNVVKPCTQPLCELAQFSWIMETLNCSVMSRCLADRATEKRYEFCNERTNKQRLVE